MSLVRCRFSCEQYPSGNSRCHSVSPRSRSWWLTLSLFLDQDQCCGCEHDCSIIHRPCRSIVPYTVTNDGSEKRPDLFSLQTLRLVSSFVLTLCIFLNDPNYQHSKRDSKFCPSKPFPERSVLQFQAWPMNYSWTKIKIQLINVCSFENRSDRSRSDISKYPIGSAMITPCTWRYARMCIDWRVFILFCSLGWHHG